MKHLRKILLAALMAGFSLPASAEDLDKLVPDAAEIFGRFKREDLINMDLVKDAKGTTVGQPYVKGATVELKVLAHRRGPKLLVYKMRPKKKTRRKNGHRQELTRVLVQSISVGGSKVA